jgi:hypothetical protein
VEFSVAACGNEAKSKAGDNWVVYALI